MNVVARRGWTYRSLVLGLTVALITSVLTSPAARAAEEGGSCGSQSSERVAEFVERWDARLHDRAFMDAWVAASETPPDIAAEGFHDLTREEQGCLAQALVDAMSVRYGASGLDASPEAVAALLFAVIFPDRSGDSEVETLDPSVAPESTALDEALHDLRTTSLRDPVQYATTSDVRVQSPGEMPPQAPSPIEVADQASWPVLQNVLRPLPRIPGVGKPLGLYRGLIDGSTYQLCAQWGAENVECSGSAAYGQAVTLNADDVDATPDVVGNVTLLPSVTTGGTSATLRLTVDKLPLESAAPAAYVYAVFERPEAEKRLLIGLDGRTERLADSSEVAVTIDVASALSGIINAKLDVRHSGAPTTDSVVFGASTPGKKGAEIDPVRAVIELADPVPDLLTATINFDVPAQVYDLGVTAAGGPLVRAGAVVDSTATNSRKRFAAEIDRLPTTVGVHVEQQTDTLSARYTASSPIEEIDFVDHTIPDLADPDDYDTLTATAHDIPATLGVTYSEPFALTYTAAAPITDLSVVRQHVVDGEVESALTGEASGLPTSLSLTGALPTDDSDELSLQYDADRPVTDLGASFFGPVATAGGEEQAAASASIEQLPTSIDLIADPSDATVSWDASAPVGKLTTEVSVPFEGRDYELFGEVVSIPAAWTLTTREDEYSFVAGTRAVPQEIGSVFVTATNHGTIDARATEPGNKALLHFDEETGDIDAALRISNIRLFEYLPTFAADATEPSGFVKHLQAGGGNPFMADLDMRLRDPEAPTDPLTQVAVAATLDPLPTDITLEQEPSGKIQYTGSSTDLEAEATIGRADAVADALSELPEGAMPVVDGPAVRDGASCDTALVVDCARALLAHVSLDGAPSSFTYTPETDAQPMGIDVNGFVVPQGAVFETDVELDDELDAAGVRQPVLRVVTTLRGFDPAGQSFHIGPIVAKKNSSGDDVIAVHVDSTAPIDPGGTAKAVVAEIQKGDALAHAELSNVPQTVDVFAYLGSNAIRFYSPLSHPIRSARVNYHLVDAYSIASPPAAGTWQLDASVSDLSKTTDLYIYPDARPNADPCDPSPPPQFPKVILSADSAGTDVVARVDASLIKPALTGFLDVRLDDLGSVVTTTFNTSTNEVDVTSNPATDLLDVRIPKMDIAANVVFGPEHPCYRRPGGGVFADLTGALNVGIHLTGAQLTIDELTAIELKPGFATGVRGTFSSFLLGWQGLSISLQPDELEGQLIIKVFGLEVPLSPKASITLEQPADVPVGVNFHTYKHGDKRIFFQRNPIALESCDPTETEGDFDRAYFQVTQNPDPLSVFANGFRVTPASTTASYSVLANPYGVIPGGLLDVATVLFLGAYDRGYGAKGGCTDEFDPWDGPPNSV